jgi:hypothetical protein
MRIEGKDCDQHRQTEFGTTESYQATKDGNAGTRTHRGQRAPDRVEAVTGNHSQRLH